MIESSSSSLSSSVQVAVRVRPMLASEAGSTQCIETLQSSLDREANVVRIGGPSGPTFSFDQAFDGQSPQEFVFQSRVAPLIERCLEGYNATVLAYGQTGSGKTHTIMGPSTALQDGESAGLIPRAVRTLFDSLQKQSVDTVGKEQPHDLEMDQTVYDYEVRVQFLELYGETIRDLLTPKPSSEKLTIRDIGNEEPEVLGATQQRVDSADEALLCLTRGMLRRVTAETAMNSTSSRSHAILSVMVQQTSTFDGYTQVKRSKFSFVDLAGSERLKRTQAQGQRMKEGVDINKGLLVLGNVISALGDETKQGKTFVPYRDSKLTRLLKGSLGGNHKTLMIACVSPSSNNLEESLNCLRYANRAKNIQNNAVVNVDAGSRLVSELRCTIQLLAKDLLRIRRGGDKLKSDSMTEEMLEKLANGDGGALISSNPSIPVNSTFAPESCFSAGDVRRKEMEIELERTNSVLLQTTEDLLLTKNELLKTRAQQERYSFKIENTNDATVRTSIPLHSDLADHDMNKRLTDSEFELFQTKDILRETNKELQSTTEDLFIARAEREMYRLRLNAGNPTDIETAFLERAARYEAEISSLKDAHEKRGLNASIDHDGSITLDSAKSSNEKRAQLLTQLQNELLSSISPEKRKRIIPINPDSPELLRLRSMVLLSISPTDQLDAEEKAEQAELVSITTKFLDEDDERGSNAIRQEEESLSKEGSERHRQLIEASLLELTNSIDEKETLIEQLQRSEEKYADMRDFYEEKLKQMVLQVRERESEREALVRELEEREAIKGDTKDLQVRLKEKETHISALKKRQMELMGLTKVSSRNEHEINRLRQDVITMKQKKVEMQNLFSQERKSHVGEIQRLKKEALQLDREVNKWKKISDKKTFEAEMAHKVSKTHLEQIGQLRAKYKEAERNQRVRTVKRGVMEKAGLDPVLIGSRQIIKSVTDANGKRGARTSPRIVEPDLASVRDFLDQKVAEIGRKEALADKLANEWEDHIELVSQKQLLLDDANGDGGISDEELEAIDVQLKYKEARIRQLAQRLGKQDHSTIETEEKQPKDFLGEKNYKSLFCNVSPQTAVEQTCRVLFGMVVKERRRVAALARTASTLDERATTARKEAAEKDDAFRAYVEEERHQRATLAQEQQEQILSLMEMVKQENRLSDKVDQALTVPVVPSGQSRVMVLANERNEALERQLLELQGERKATEMYKKEATETSKALVMKNEECDELHLQLNSLQLSLRQIREALTNQKVDSGIETSDCKPYYSGTEDNHEVIELVMDALRDWPGDRLKTLNQNLPLERGKTVSTSYNRHCEGIHTSDSEGDEEIPLWAGDIMADLAVIAEGEIPDALLNSSTFADFSQPPKEKNSSSVFDRLTNPNNFTGVQKQKSVGRVGSQRAKQERKDLARKISDNLEKVVVPDLKSASEDVTGEIIAEGASGDPVSKPITVPQNISSDAVEKTERRSVFDRLLSPSAYTGTQKERIHRTQKNSTH